MFGKLSSVSDSRTTGTCLEQVGKLGNSYSAIVSRATKAGRETKDCTVSRPDPEVQV